MPIHKPSKMRLWMSSVYQMCGMRVYRRKERSEATLKLVTTSGIPELRIFCYLLCANSRFEEAQHFIRHTLSSIISSIGVHSRPESFSPAKNSTNNLAKLEDIKCSVWKLTALCSTVLFLFDTDLERVNCDWDAIWQQLQGSHTWHFWYVSSVYISHSANLTDR